MTCGLTSWQLHVQLLHRELFVEKHRCRKWGAYDKRLLNTILSTIRNSLPKISYRNLIISSAAISASSRRGDRKNIVVHFSGRQTLRLYCSMFFNYSVACVGRGSAKHIRTQKWIFSWPFVRRYFLFSFYVFTAQHKKKQKKKKQYFFSVITEIPFLLLCAS